MIRRVLLGWVIATVIGAPALGQEPRAARLAAPQRLAGTLVAPAPEGAIQQASATVPAYPPGTGFLPAPQPTPASAAPAYSGAPNDCAPADPVTRLTCASCGPDERGWVRAEYLVWAVQSGSVPPLVTRDASNTPRAAVGLPTTPGQRTLFGNQNVNGDLRSGFRIEAGYWLDENRLWGASGDFFLLGATGDGGRFASIGVPPLARPFFNARTGLPDAQLVAFPGVLAGSATVSARNTFGGAGGFLQRNLCCDFDACGTGYRIDALAGYRYYRMTDDLDVGENLLGTGQGVVPLGTRIAVADHFRTENTFNGALLGLTGSGRMGNWLLNVRGGAALGNMHRELSVAGGTTVFAFGQPNAVRPVGLLAQPSNSGRFTSNTFTVVPEVGVSVGYQVTQHLSVSVGYQFLYLSNTWRAGDQIDRGVDPLQLLGSTGLRRPAPVLASTGAAVQGISFGATFRY